MNHYWNCRRSNFQPHQNQQTYTSSQEDFESRKYTTRAYINPHVANYEHIKRSLTKTPSLGSNKIHVNPNFKRNQENYINFNNLIYSTQSYPGRLNDSFQSRPSNTSSQCDERINSKTDSDVQVTSKSKYQKINKANSSESKYSWFKSENFNKIPKSSSGSFLKSSANCKKPVSHQDLYKCITPKKGKIPSPEKTIPRIYLSKTKIINKSKTKLVNSNAKVSKKSMKISSSLKIPSYQFDNTNKKSVVLKIAKAVTNKYKYYSSSKSTKSVKYKIDKRNKAESLKKGSLKGISDISKLHPNPFHTKLKLVEQECDSTLSKNMCLQKKNHLSQQVNPIIAKPFPNKGVVKIGGMLYKTTVNKLILAKRKGEKKQSQSKAKNHIVCVRGEKFLLNNNGKTLRRQLQNMTYDKNLLPKRIDIGGVTYIQKSKNVLVRKNMHQAQYLVNKAKNKSIAILTNLRKRSTMPCMIYHKFGNCNRHNKGFCMYKHDPKNIAICKMFLKGSCKNNNCLLSHQAIPEKMATCHFFLNGFCDRDNCPFPHVKLNKNVAICQKFLQGFCNLGKECPKRHLLQCPNFDKYGTCSLGSKCHYPHKVLNKKQSLNDNTNKASENEFNENNQKVQYFIHSGIQESKGKIKKGLIKKEHKKGRKMKLKTEHLSWDSSPLANDTIECVPKRIKLDKLPCFIPLQKDA